MFDVNVNQVKVQIYVLTKNNCRWNADYNPPTNRVGYMTSSLDVNYILS